MGALFPADLPDPHVSHREAEGFAEQFADLVGVRSDLSEVINEQQHGRQRKHTGEKTQIPKLHQELNVFCKQSLSKQKAMSEFQAGIFEFEYS